MRIPPSLPSPYTAVAMALKTRRWTALEITYIGGLHSPPVAQPTAIHQDIQLGGEEVGAGVQSLRWVISGQDQGPHGSAERD